MIKINLLPKEVIKKKEEVISLSTLKFIIPIAVTFLVIIGLIAYMEITKAQIKQDIENQRKTLETLKIKIEEAKRFEAMNKEIETKTKLIEELKKRQNIPVIILSSLAKKLPDGIWLTGFSYDDAVTVEGFGFSNLNVVAFVENLKATPELQDVYLVESLQTEYEKQSVYKFIVKFKLKV